MKLLKELCAIHGPSGEEYRVRDFLIKHIKKESKNWKTKPVLFYGPGFGNALVLVFGKPRTAVLAHMDSVGFHVKYNKELIPIGGPAIIEGCKLRGADSKGKIECTLRKGEDDKITYDCLREIDRGTSLVFVPGFKEEKHVITSPYLDNRLGVWCSLKTCETLSDGIIAFTTGEEQSGGSVEFLAKFITEQYNVTTYLVCDITWITEGILEGGGAAVSLRDRSIPNRKFVMHVCETLKKKNIPFQMEVESSGGSDGMYLQRVPYALDWCFIGAAEKYNHSPGERVHKKDIDSMLKIYRHLFKEL